MREPGGLRKIVEAIEKLKPRHKWHIKHYGQGNEVGCFGVFVAFFFFLWLKNLLQRRLTGRHETASIDVFSYGVADRGASIRIPRQTDKDGCGYAEDRRPASNCDPYVVTRLLMETCILNIQGENSYVPPNK